MKDSGHTWSHKEDFHKATSDLEASRGKVKELETAVKEWMKTALAYEEKYEEQKDLVFDLQKQVIPEMEEKIKVYKYSYDDIRRAHEVERETGNLLRKRIAELEYALNKGIAR